jgi:hypothetical protein
LQIATVWLGKVIMMAKFYAFDNVYGFDTRDNDNNRIGSVMVFHSRSARDEWVKTDTPYDGRYRREIITAKEARREMVRAAYDYMLNEHVVSGRDDLRYLPMDTITRMYAQVMA